MNESEVMNKLSERKSMAEFIDKYRSFTALWDFNSPEYNDKKLKNAQYDELFVTYLKHNPQGDLPEMKRKINTLRTNYKRELKRVNEGNETCLWYYEAMSFLGDFGKSSISKSPIIDEDPIEFLAGRNCGIMSARAVKENREAEKKFTLEFIECYHSLTALWDIKSEEYNDRIKKAKQYKRLLEKYQERYPDADKKDVCRKINTLRSNFKREWKRINCPDQSDNSSENTSEVKLWYYDEISFIKDIEKSNTPKESPVNDEPLLKKSKKYIDEDNLIKLACTRLAESASRDPESEYLSKAWCNEFKEMASDQKIIVKKLLSDLIYYGSQGMLNGYHVYQFNQLITNSTESTNRLTPANDDFTAETIKTE